MQDRIPKDHQKRVRERSDVQSFLRDGKQRAGVEGAFYLVAMAIFRVIAKSEGLRPELPDRVDLWIQYCGEADDS